MRKAVIPAAGFGTRFLPATKSLPKEMLPVVDKPVIQYIVEEVVASGIDQIILITGWNKRAIEDHFDYNFELESQLLATGKEGVFQQLRTISDMAHFVYVRQKMQLGNGHAVLCAKDVVDEDEPIVVLWGDDFIDANPPRVKQLVDVHNRYQSSVLSVIRTDNPEDANRYGFVDGEEVEPGLVRVRRIVEKPGAGNAPSNLAMVSGCVLNPGIMAALGAIEPGKNGEIWLVDAINDMLKSQQVYALEIRNGRYYDCGNKLEYLKANIDFALRRPDLAEGLMDYLRHIVATAPDSGAIDWGGVPSAGLGR
ncbi:MAG TPA: UTP--glucose-1-phosphate uridylyltransferase [Armatimonadota bacterium]